MSNHQARLTRQHRQSQAEWSRHARTMSTSRRLHSPAISSTLPLPTYVRALGACMRCVVWPTTSSPAVSASCSSSSSESCHTHTRTHTHAHRRQVASAGTEFHVTLVHDPMDGPALSCG